VTRAEGEPWIRRLAALDVGSPPPPTWNDPVNLWADDAAGRWSGGQVEIDLAPRLETPGRYRVRLVAQSGTPVVLGNAVLEIDGAPATQALERDGSRSDVFHVSVSGHPASAVLRGTANPPQGVALVRRE